MNKILPLFDAAFVLDFFQRELPPLYPAFSAVKSVVIKPYKKQVWETTYHVVIGFDVIFAAPGGREETIPVVCSAHSEEPRENIFLALKYLWARDFPTAGIDLPRPLFYSPEFRGTFYQGLVGENLLHYIKIKDEATVAEIIGAAAGLFARLHRLPVPAADFNPQNARLKTVIPGVEFIFKEMAARYHNRYDEDFKKIYRRFIDAEEKFLAASPSLCLIHGDAHPGNIIKTGPDKIGLIDFTDLCRGDFARDLGAFCQQLDYKLGGSGEKSETAARLKELFLASYLRSAGLEMDADLKRRVDLYYQWTAMRTVVFWFLRDQSDPKRGEELLRKVKEDLGL